MTEQQHQEFLEQNERVRSTEITIVDESVLFDALETIYERSAVLTARRRPKDSGA